MTDTSDAQDLMDEQLTALASLLEEGLVTQAKYDVLVVKILSGGGVPDFLDDSSGDENEEDKTGERSQEKSGIEKEQVFSYESDENEEDMDIDDKSICSRSSSLFCSAPFGGESDNELSSDEEDLNLRAAAVSNGASLGFSALYKQHSLVDAHLNPAVDIDGSAPLPTPPSRSAPPPNPVDTSKAAPSPRTKPLNKNLDVVGGGSRPKNSPKKALSPTADTDIGTATKTLAGNRRGFFRQASSFEAAKFNPSVAASIKRNQFDIILIDGREYPPPSCPPPAGDVPTPPPITADDKAEWERISGGEQSQIPRQDQDRSSNSSVASHTTADPDLYKQKQFAMRPELLSAALKKRSQWALNRQDSSEFYK